jgi:hypothetical protein
LFGAAIVVAMLPVDVGCALHWPGHDMDFMQRADRTAFHSHKAIV